jgi:hypothetical protein
VGGAVTVIRTSSDEGGQLPLVIVQRKVFSPVPRPVTPELGSFEFERVPEPPINVHVPVPAAGVFPAKLVELPQIAWSGPAFETDGGVSRLMTISSVEGGQLPLLIVHRITLVPNDSPVTVVFGSPGAVMTPEPETNDHAPDPTAGVFPASVAEAVQIIWSGPALATVGRLSLVITTPSVEGGQAPLLIVQMKIFGPGPRPVIPLPGWDGFAMDPLPERSVQIPEPTAGVFPARVAESAHTDWSGPAFDTVGFVLTPMMTSSHEVGQTPLEIVQRNTLFPVLRLETEVLGSAALENVPVPKDTVHWPEPIKGVLAARVEVVVQIAWSGPALARVGGA